jgi:hypothetical protein
MNQQNSAFYEDTDKITNVSERSYLGTKYSIPVICFAGGEATQSTRFGI